MNIRQLIIYKTVCKHLSFTKAAKELYISQPAISKTISDLEAELGFNLLERINHKIYINEAGKAFLDKTLQVLEIYHELENNFKQEYLYPTINIGSSITIATFVLPTIIKDFNLQYPEIKIKVIVDSAKEIETKLLNNEIDIALIEGVNNHQQLIRIPFSKFKIIALASPKHHLVHKEIITLKELQQTNVLLREKGSAIRTCLDSALLLKNIILEPIWTSVNSQALIEACKNNLGITFLPEILVSEELNNHSLIPLTILDLSLNNTNYLVYHHDKPLNQSLNIFINFIKNNT